MIKAKNTSNEYVDIVKVFAGSDVQKDILKIWSSEANAFVFEATADLTAPLPLTITTDGTPLLDYRIYGNTVQTGTPTPESPIMPEGVGERTENLWNVPLVQGVWRASDGLWLAGNAGYVSNTSKVSVDAETTYSFNFTSASIETINRLYAYFWDSDNIYLGYQDLLSSRVINTPSNAVFLAVSIGTTATSGVIPSDISNVMLTAGSTPPASYIPYGYKLPMVSRGENLLTTTPIYIGDTKLAKDEYVSYSEQKVYKRTENDFPFAEKGTFAFGDNGNIISDGEGKFVVSMPSETPSGTSSAIIPLNRPYTVPKSVDAGGEFVFYLGNNDVKNLYLVFYDADGVQIDFWACNAKWRIATAYTFMAGKTISYVGMRAIATIFGNIELTPMFSKNANLSSYIPYFQLTDPPVPLPLLPTTEGETTFEYGGGEPQPEQMYVKYNRIK